MASVHVRERQNATSAIQLLLSLPLLAMTLALASSCRSQPEALSDQRGRHPSDSSSPIVRVRPLTDRKFERTPERFARGQYLVEGIGEGFACHGPSDVKRPGWPPIPGKEGSGFDYTTWGYPGQIAPNITPDRETGVRNWTDDMLARAIREGVGHDGHLLDPAAM